MISALTDAISARQLGIAGALALVLLLPVVLFVGGASAQAVGGNPDLEAYVEDPTIDRGSEATLNIQVANDAKADFGSLESRDRVTMARNVIVDVEAPDDAPFTIETERHSIGSVSESQPAQVPIRITVPEGADPGRYELDVEMKYSYTDSLYVRGEVENEATRRTTDTVIAEVDDSPQFKLNTVDDSDVRIGETGTFRAEVTNIGAEPASGVSVMLESNSPALQFNTANADVARAGDLAPGESTLVTYRLPIPDGAPVRTYELDGTVEFTDPDGIRMTDTDPTLGLEVGSNRDDFLVEAVDTTVASGDSRLIEVEVTNNKQEQVTNVEAKLSASDPLDSEDDEGYIGTLGPGESATMLFELSATDQAVEKTYAASIDIRYDDSEGRSKLTDTYKIPVDVTESSGSGLFGWLLPGAVGLTALGAAGTVAYRVRS